MAVETRFLTVEEYLAYSNESIEIVDGEVIEMSPYGKRQPIVMANLMYSLGPFVNERKLGKVLPEASFVLDAERRTRWVKNARTPDVSFIMQARIDAHMKEYPDPNEPWWLAPDLAAEVISPTDKAPAILRKLRDYLHYGVNLIWFIDPDARTVTVYTLDNPVGVVLTEAETLTAEPVIEGWSMPVAALFE